MIINGALTSSLSIAADKAMAEVGDDNTRIPAIIHPVEKILSPHHILVAAAGRIATTSFVTSFEKLRAASTGNTADVIVTLPRGLWTITWNMHLDFQSTGTNGQTAAVLLLLAMENDTKNFCAAFRTTSNQFLSGVFRLLLGADANIRLDIGATGVSDAIDAHVTLNGEKNI